MSNFGGAKFTHFLAELIKSIKAFGRTFRGPPYNINNIFLFSAFIYQTLPYSLLLPGYFPHFQAGQILEAFAPSG